ncbi:c-type cytochrome biogenesis protein CcmI [Nitratireductor mangrovi]|uniref:C-type cytochrome biogenesis protein CcmI n=1 Tax=Nitratireductor mangrovi TaxID=2599600 RepID=A0A5B8L011_9HYPH|nr:c-type cytochrome biogenesis protein CcmI [Nitratireductor mangrovi]QDZ01132.1 c-type cytochrome biogenesis protein CcmI [Nitratireductor mangrovi]
MIFWVILAFLTAAACLAVILPLAGRKREAASAAAHDREVYRDQMAEIARDAERGLIGEREAEEARAEIGRRLIRAEDEAARARGTGTVVARLVATVAVLAIPLLSWGLYSVIGSPDLPGQPLAARLAKDPAQASVEELVARAEAHLRANPADGRGWDVLAPIYLRLNRGTEAQTAYRNAIRLLGPSAARETGLGEAIYVGAGGIVTREAVEAFRRAIDLGDGPNPKARFYLATAMAQEGRMDEATAALKALRAELPGDSPWLGVVAEALARADGEKQLRTAKGPSQAEMDAAAEMDADDRSAMIETMVAGLDQRLRENPADPDGWRRLIRSYSVLGRAEEARDALARAVTALGPDSAEAGDLRSFAATLNLGEIE